MRRLLTLLLIVAALGLISRGAVSCEVLQAQPQCYAALHPGPTENTLTIVKLDGEPTFASAGQLLLTTVGVDANVDLFEWIAGRFDPSVRQLDRKILFPPDQGDAEIEQQNAEQMASSQRDSIVAALRFLGRIPVAGVLVAEVAAGSNATGIVLPGDLVVAVEGVAVDFPSAAVAQLSGRQPGERVALSLVRDGGPVEVTVELYAAEPGGRGLVGLSLSDAADVPAELPIDVTIDAGAIGGPSAGMMFALALIDLLGADDLTGGRIIAGTGTITLDGVVGPIGGITQKVIGALERGTDDEGVTRPPAEVFLTPIDNVEEIRRAPVDRRITVVPIATLADAVRALRDLRDGVEPAGSFVIGPRG